MCVILLAGGVNLAAQGEPPEESLSCEGNRLVVYYFHSNFRSYSCLRIERLAKETLQKRFEKELAKGEVVFKKVNVEKKENRYLIDRYRLYTNSLVIAAVRDGQEVGFKNLSLVRQYLWSEKKFFEYVEKEIRLELKELF